MLDKQIGGDFLDLNTLLARLGVETPCTAEPFRNAEDGESYEVWKIATSEGSLVLKPAKEYEAEVYTTFLSGTPGYAPQLLGVTRQEERTWMLLEYIDGEDLRFCTREKLKLTLDALIAMQKQWWDARGYENAAFSQEKARPGRIRRGEDLDNPALQKAYEMYLRYYETLPRTLCHEDLLPFNILVSRDRAVLIDWEYAGMQPYLSSLARLIAHGEEGEDAFFHMKEEDRAFAIDYYYRNLPKKKGIRYEEYRKALDAFLLYEYCEWVMLGVRYGDRESPRYQRYLSLALDHIQKNTFKEENKNGNES